MSAFRVPKYCLHSPTGQAYVRIRGRMIYLGKYASPPSQEAYGRIVAELAATSAVATNARGGTTNDLTIVELCAAYFRFAREYYKIDGEQSDWLGHIRLTITRLCQLYGSTNAVDFSPLKFKAVRQSLIDAGLSRPYINKLMAIIPRILKWGASEELVPASVYQALRTVEGLKRGRTTAREPKPVEPVGSAVVDATLTYLPAVVADMVRFQRLTAARPGEVCSMRPCDIDRSKSIWRFVPSRHKTEHLGRRRVVFIGPQAQQVLTPYLRREAEAYCFSPRDSEKQRLTQRREHRVTPLSCGNVPQSNRKTKRSRAPKEHYTKDSYRRAVARAVERANVSRQEQGLAAFPHWHPNQLRHSKATEVREHFGLEAAQVVLGHSKADVTQVYAERDFALAERVAQEIG